MAFIGDSLDDFARLKPDAVALVHGDCQLTWRTFVEQIQCVQDFLTSTTGRGERTVERVALLLQNPVSLLVSFFACARSARIAMVMDAQWPADQCRDIAQATGPECRIDDQVFEKIIETSMSCPDLQNTGMPTPIAETPFYVGFTSGSTGLPKGYIRDHGSWLESFSISDTEIDPAMTTRIVLPGRLSHSLHLYGAVHGLDRGIQVHVARHFDPRSILDDLTTAEGGAVLYATPTHLHMIADAALLNGTIEAVSLVFSSGAKWQDEDRAELSRIFTKARLIEFYGASEASFISWALPEHKIPEGSVGRLAAGVAVAIGDPSQPFQSGKQGSIWVKSRLLFSGYICGDAPETKWQDGWLTVGDHGYLDDNGFLFLTGRNNRMIITSGLNVYPEQVEAALQDHPLVVASVVFGSSDRLRGQKLEAVIQLSKQLSDPVSELQKHCRNKVGADKSPRRFHFMDQIPLTAGGKPDIQLVLNEISSFGQGKQ
ncbi:MAG: AMP-binding protein [Roseibium sp.]